MARKPISASKFEAQFLEQLEFIEDSAAAFDAGREREFKRIAVHLRVLFHDTLKSTSLMTHLGRKAGLSLPDTAPPVDDNNFATESGFVAMNLTASDARYTPLFDGPWSNTKAFDDWWTDAVMRDKERRPISRKDLVLTVANQDGGAHVDSGIDETYFNLTENNSLNWYAGSVEAGRAMASPVPAAIRQIAHEVLKALKIGYQFSPPKADGITLVGASVTTATPTGSGLRLPGLGGGPYVPRKSP